MTGRVPAGWPAVLLIMGVSGSGKSTAGERLAHELGCPFRDADSFHPAANIEKMSRGVPLTDEDRWPWLAAISAWIEDLRSQPPDAHSPDRSRPAGIVSCSALKRVYRRVLLDGRSDVRLVYLSGDIELIEHRMTRRTDHFMPPALLRSQFDTLEEPQPEERPIIIPIYPTPRRIIEAILAELTREADLPDIA